MRTIILCTLLLSLFSCHKDDMPIYQAGDMEHGSLNACRNGKNWEASGTVYRYLGKVDTFGLGGSTYTEEGSWREALGIGEVPLRVGKYTVSKNPLSGGFFGKPVAGYSTMTSDGDVLEDIYLLDEDCNNYIKVTKLDTIANKVAGYFELHFVVQQPKKGEQNSEEVYFKNGTFEVDIRLVAK